MITVRSVNTAIKNIAVKPVKTLILAVFGLYAFWKPLNRATLRHAKKPRSIP